MSTEGLNVVVNKERVQTLVANAKERVAYVRTSDMNQFLNCRRRWDWTSHLRQCLGAKVYANPLWLGSGIHWALEDFHSDKRYGTPGKAFQAFVFAHYKKNKDKLPDDWKELARLGTDMMDYYPLWLQGREPIETYIHEGVPQVEPAIHIEIPLEKLPAYDRIKQKYDRAIYALQLDRVAIIDDELWVIEYKTAKTMQTNHFPNDAQISAYIWAATYAYQKPVAGVIYMQFRKDLPKGGRILKNGTVSLAQNQRTSHRLYRKTLLDVYKDMSKVPHDNIEYLNDLAARETPDSDDFIRRDKIYRNPSSVNTTAQRILAVTNDLLDPALPIYTTPTRQCGVFCPLMSVCTSRDDGSDWEYELEMDFEKRDMDYESWRPFLPDETEFKGLKLT